MIYYLINTEYDIDYSFIKQVILINMIASIMLSVHSVNSKRYYNKMNCLFLRVLHTTRNLGYNITFAYD